MKNTHFFCKAPIIAMKDLHNLEDISKVKTENETIYFNILALYITKMLKRSEGIPKKQFQKQMVNIAYWDNETKKKKYNKFLKWAAKKHHIHIDPLFKTIVQCYFDLLKSKASLIDQINFFHKGVKAIARYYYENVFNEPDRDTIAGILHFTIQTMLPLPNDVSTTTTYTYDFSKSTKSTCSDIPCSVNLLIEKKARSETDELEYLSSEGFMFNPDPIMANTSTHPLREKEVKEIKLVKMKKGNVSGKVLDEIDENFFDT